MKYRSLLVYIVFIININSTMATKNQLLISFLKGINNTTPPDFESNTKTEYFKTIGYCSFPELLANSGHGMLLDIVADKIGAKTCIDQWGMQNTYGKPLSGLEAMSYGLANFGGGYDVIENHNIPNVKFFSPHAFQDICMMIPRKPPARSSLFSPFSISVWSLIVATICVLIATLRLCGITDAPLQVWKTFLTGVFSQKKPFVQRILFLLISVSGFILLSACSGCFVGILTHPTEQRQIDTLEEAIASVGIVWYTYDFVSFLQQLDDNLKKKLFKKELTGIIEEGTIKQKMIEKHIVSECVVTGVPTAFLGRADWPLFEKVNNIIMASVEAGIVIHFDRLYNEFSRLSFFKYITPVHNSVQIGENIAFTMDILKEPFIILASGISLAIVAFALELLSTRNWFLRMIHLPHKGFATK